MKFVDEQPIDAIPVVAPEAAPAAQLQATLPAMTLAMFERRHLDQSAGGLWTPEVRISSGFAGRPVLARLREVHTPAFDPPPEVMSSVMSATHAAGMSQVYVVHGTGTGHEIHLGGRRSVRSDRGLDELLHGQANALSAHSPGSTLDAPIHIEHPELAHLERYLGAAPVLAAATGWWRESAARQLTFVDRLVGATRGRRYAVMVVAEPIPTEDVDRMIELCRAMRSVLHTLIGHSEQYQIGESQFESRSTSVSETSWAQDTGVSGGAVLEAFLAFAAGFGVPGAMATARHLSISESEGRTASASRSTSLSMLDAHAEAADLLVQRHVERLRAARAATMWSTAVYIATDDEHTLSAIGGALRGSPELDPDAEPVRIHRIPSHVLRQAMAQGEAVVLKPAGDAAGHPLGHWFDLLATPLSSPELGELVALPRRDVPGLVTRTPARFALTVPNAEAHAAPLGVVLDPGGHPLQPIELPAASLNRHTLIAGMPGYGKTTTAKALLVETWTRLGVPFLVIEPVKAEYRALARHPRLREHLNIYGIGDPAVRPLRLNPFTPVPGTPLFRHIDLLKAVFNASFPMFAGMSYVLDEAIVRVYQERGWDIERTEHPSLGARPAADDLAALTPALGDLHDTIERVLTERNYAREVHQNMGAALRSRLRSLTTGAKGLALDGTRSIGLDDLFSRPCVIELRNLGDDEEKSFVMALLLTHLSEFAEARQREGDPAAPHPLQHLTLIEEAHRLLRAPRWQGGAESADAQAKAVRMFTDLLAEMRAYGEGFVVADQIPSGLAPEVIKNSNIKILHRLTAPDDRSVMSASMNLTDEQSRHLVGLAPGRAVLHDDRLDRAVLVEVRPSLDSEAAPIPEGARRTPDRSYLRRNGGCARCPRPCTFRRVDSDGGAADRTRTAARRVVAGLCAPALDEHGLHNAWTRWAAAWAAYPFSGPDAEQRRRGGAYCQLTQLAHEDLLRLVAARCNTAGAGFTTPAERLRADAAARVVARLCGDLAAGLDQEKSVEALAEAHREVHDLLSSVPPVEWPGCESCPARCRSLATLVDLPPATWDTIRARATMPVPPATTARQLLNLLEGEATLPASPTRRTEIAHCAVTLVAGPNTSQLAVALAAIGATDTPDVSNPA